MSTKNKESINTKAEIKRLLNTKLGLRFYRLKVERPLKKVATRLSLARKAKHRMAESYEKKYWENRNECYAICNELFKLLTDPELIQSKDEMLQKKVLTLLRDIDTLKNGEACFWTLHHHFPGISIKAFSLLLKILQIQGFISYRLHIEGDDPWDLYTLTSAGKTASLNLIESRITIGLYQLGKIFNVSINL